MLRLSSLLKLPIPLPQVGIGQEMRVLEVELLYGGEELEEVLFEDLGLLFGDVVGTSVDYEFIGIRVGLQDSWDFIHDV